MRITEIIQPKLSSAVVESKTQDLVPQHTASQVCVSAIAEGVSQILRRVKGKGLKPGFRCTSGVRKGRIVSKPSTCFMRKDTVKGAKIAKKRQVKARTAGRKLAVTKRTGGTSQRLKRAQIKTGTRLDRPKLKARSRMRARPLAKYSKIARPS